jgi:hypothetical protein
MLWTRNRTPVKRISGGSDGGMVNFVSAVYLSLAGP